jgi:phage baseplate assembly protein W
MHIDVPWHYDTRGRTAESSDDDHVRDMLELLIFTDPGERVNRPGFGCGVRQLVFAPNSSELAAAVQFTMQAAIERELGEVLTLHHLDVTGEEATLRVVVEYVVTRSGTTTAAVFERVIL